MLSDDDILLVRAACGRGAPAVDSWRAWRARVDLDDVNPGCAAILPGLARRTDLLAADPDAGRLRGLYRHTWAANTVLWHAAQPVLEDFAHRGICFAPVQGAALVGADDDRGLRRLDVVDLVIGHQQVDIAGRLLLARGWRPGAVWSGPSEGRIVLHPHAVSTSMSDQADAQVWSRSRPARLGRMLDPVDLTLHQLLDGTPDAAWCVDLHHLLATPGIVGVLGARLRDHGALGRGRERLGLLADATGDDAPLGAVRRTRPGALDRLGAAAPVSGRAGRAAQQVVAHAGDVGLRAGVGSLVGGRLDLQRAARPAATVLHAVAGRSPVAARVLRRRGPIAGVDTGAPVPTGTVLDLSDVEQARTHCATGWRDPAIDGVSSHSNEGRLALTLAQPSRLVLRLTTDQRCPVVVTLDEREVARTPGRGGPAEVSFAAPAGYVEIALRASLRRGLWPAPLFVRLQSIEVA